MTKKRSRSAPYSTFNNIICIKAEQRRRTNDTLFDVANNVENETILLARLRGETKPSADHLRKEIARLGRSGKKDAVD